MHRAYGLFRFFIIVKKGPSDPSTHPIANFESPGSLNIVMMGQDGSWFIGLPQAGVAADAACTAASVHEPAAPVVPAFQAVVNSAREVTPRQPNPISHLATTETHSILIFVVQGMGMRLIAMNLARCVHKKWCCVIENPILKSGASSGRKKTAGMKG